MLLFVSYELLKGTDTAEFRRWSRDIDIPATRELPGVVYFAGAKDREQDNKFIEFIQISDSVATTPEAWMAHVAEHMPQTGQAQFESYVDVATVKITAFDETQMFENVER